MADDRGLSGLRERCRCAEDALALVAGDAALLAATITLEAAWRTALGERLEAVVVRLAPKDPSLVLVQCRTRLTASALDRWLWSFDAGAHSPTHPRLRFGITPRQLVIPEPVAAHWHELQRRCRVPPHCAEAILAALDRHPRLLENLLAQEARLREAFGPALESVDLDLHCEHEDGLPVLDLRGSTSLPLEQLEEACRTHDLGSSSSPDPHIWTSFVHR